MEPTTIHGSLRPAFALARGRYRDGLPVRLDEIFASLGTGAVPLLTMLLATPFAFPLSLGPITTPFSIGILLLGWHMVRGGETLPGNGRWLSFPMPEKILRLIRRIMVLFGRWFGLHRAEVKPPQKSGSAFRIACGWGVVVGAILLAVPVPLLPLTNTFPALGVAAFCLAVLMHSRLMYLGGIVCCIIGTLIFVAIAIGAWMIAAQIV